MKLSIIGSLIVWASVSAALADELVNEFEWSRYKMAGKILAGGGTSGPDKQLEINNPTNVPNIVKIFEITGPGLTMLSYAMEGSVRYENVEKGSYLEMWCWFADGSQYFSRTLADSGPMQRLEGSSDWRPFTLPFSSNAKVGLPNRIVVNVVFTGRGTVYLSPLKLIQYRAGRIEELRLIYSGRGWWSEQTAGLIGGIGGSIIGVLGGLIGILASFGKARWLVLTLTAVLVVLGVLSLVLGVIALAIGQPYAVHYPLLLGGLIMTAVCGGNLPNLRRRYEQLELRKMAAMDSR